MQKVLRTKLAVGHVLIGSINFIDRVLPFITFICILIPARTWPPPFLTATWRIHGWKHQFFLSLPLFGAFLGTYISFFFSEVYGEKFKYGNCYKHTSTLDCSTFFRHSEQGYLVIYLISMTNPNLAVNPFSFPTDIKYFCLKEFPQTIYDHESNQTDAFTWTQNRGYWLCATVLGKIWGSRRGAHRHCH